MSGRRNAARGRGNRFSEALYRALLHLYPRAFRAEFEPVLVEAFHARRRMFRTRPRVVAPLAFWWHIVRDLVTSVPRSRRAGEGLGGSGKAPHERPRAGRADLVSTLAGETRAALRRLRRRPGLALMARAIVALGISGTTLVFSVVDGVLLEPLPYVEPERIVRLWADQPQEGIDGFTFTKIEFRHFFEHNEVFDSIGGDFPVTVTLTGAGDPARLRGAFVTPGYFETFGVRPRLGRFIDFDDIDGDDLDLVVISHRLWQRRLGGDEGAIGGTLILNDRPMTVVGVLPAGYRHLDDDYDVFVPYTRGTSGWIGRWLNLSARLAPGVGVEQAQANLDAMMATLAEDQERSNGWNVTIEPIGEWAVGNLRAMLVVLLAAVGLVLLLACTNVANLLLAQATTRRRETAIRLALGASRAQVARQHLIEGLVVACAGGIAGVLAANWTLPLLLDLGAHALPRLMDVSIDPRVLGVAAVLTVGSGILFSMAPAWYGYRAASRRSFAPRSAAVGGDAGPQRLLSSLIVIEVALTLAVLVGAGLLLRSFERLEAVEIGVQSDGVLTASVALPGTRYRASASVHAFFDELLARVKGLPGVESASLSAYLPLDGEGAITSVTNADRLQRGITERIATLQRVVRKDFFRTMGIPLLRGRNFDETEDLARARQLIISESLARTLWPDEDPIGKRVTSRIEPAEEDWREVIGVVGDVRYVDLRSNVQPQIYESHFERPWREAWVVLRTTGDPRRHAGDLRRLVAELDDQVPVADIRTMDDIAGRSVAGPRFALLVLSVFAATSVLLACAGIYGVVSFAVGQRTREIGVRMTLGATRGGILRQALRRAMVPVALGVALGMVLAAVFSRALAGMLFEINPIDPATYVIGAALLTIVASLASWLPAKRAATIDPIAAIREEQA